jgi:hypothetical protein
VRGWLDRQDLLAGWSDSDVLHAVLRLADHASLLTRSGIGADGWEAEQHWLSLAGPIASEAVVDEATAAFVGRCDGRRAVAEVIASLAGTSAGTLSADDRRQVVALVRGLMSAGFLVAADYSPTS